MRSVLDSILWVIFLTFLPFTVLALLSQNSLPGSPFYAVKRGMEGGILAVASLSPSTKAAFHTELADRRFGEAEELLLASASTAGLDDLVKEVKFSRQAVISLPDKKDKIAKTKKLIASINEYQSRLAQAQTKVQGSTSLPQTNSGSSAQGSQNQYYNQPSNSANTSQQQQNSPQKSEQSGNNSKTLNPNTRNPADTANSAGQPGNNVPAITKEEKKQVEDSISTTNDELEATKKDLMRQLELDLDIERFIESQGNNQQGSQEGIQPGQGIQPQGQQGIGGPQDNPTPTTIPEVTDSAPTEIPTL